ncbi:MAG TPA: leucine-rich repeat protein, partial [Mycobacterium sp.]|nr:leucine-rich repeat protein [Mycobacterium sp.]
AGTLATSCYASMFKDCTSLAEAPGLAATNLANYCCYAMFSGCTSLTNAPTLPATTLAGQCYYKMFSGCTGLTATPLLPATNLASYCYANMFEGCTGLTRLPTLPATTLATACYNAMFSGCTSITLHETGTAPTWGIPAEAQDEDALAWNQNMLAGTGGTFTGNPAIGATYYYTATPPASTAYLTFASTNTFTITPQEASWNGTLETSTDTTNWVTFTTAGATAAANANSEYRLYIRGTTNTCITGLNKPGWNITAAAPVACSGNIETLLDYQTVDNGEHPEMDAYCFANLFNGCTALSSAPALPATTLADYCYYCMFWGCTGLTVPPELSATTLAEGCYCGMFYGCTGLTNAPALPATTLAEWCYYKMFGDCTGLTEPPTLPATTLAEGCYNSMFGDCTGLTHLPDLPATTLANYCYYRMFEGCTGIKLNTEGPGIPWGIPAGANPVGSWNQDMLAGTGGTFTGNPVIGTTYYYTPSTPPVSTAYLTFASTNTFTVKPQEASWNGTLECSTDTTNWVAFTTAGATAAANANGEYKLYLRGSNNTRITGSGQPGW